MAQECNLSHLTQTLKSALGRWIRQMVASQLLFSPQNTERYDAFRVRNTKRRSISVSPEQYNNIRRTLESLDEYPVLADVIKMCSYSHDIAVLTIASVTVNHHFEIFSVIGAADDLFQTLYDRYEEFYGQAVKQKPFTESLIDLDYRLSQSKQGRARLHHKLLLYDHDPTLEACSPISDYMSEPLLPSESEFMDAVEQSFTSGTLMEKQVLEQLFIKITTRLQKSWLGSGDKAISNLTDLLLRLRNYGIGLFENLLRQWLDGFFASTSRPGLLDVMPSLICAGVITLSTALERIMIAYDDVGDEQRGARLCLEAFELLTLSDEELEHILPYVRISLKRYPSALII